MSLQISTGIPIKSASPAADSRPSSARLTPVLEIPWTAQEQEAWCWAACAQMVINYFDSEEKVSQCELVRYLRRHIKRLPNINCCNSPRRKACSEAYADHPDISAVYENWGVKATRSRGSIAIARLKSELTHGRPVEICFRWDNDDPNVFTGHVIIVRGVVETRSGDFFIINDPLTDYRDGAGPGSGRVSYKELKEAYGLGRWHTTWSGLNRSVGDGAQR